MPDNPSNPKSKPAPGTSTETTPASRPPSGPTPRFKRYYPPHELERERIRRELAEPYRIEEMNGDQRATK